MRQVSRMESGDRAQDSPDFGRGPGPDCAEWPGAPRPARGAVWRRSARTLLRWLSLDPGVYGKPGRGRLIIGTCIVLAAIFATCFVLILAGSVQTSPAVALTRSRAAYRTFSKATNSFAVEARGCKGNTNQLACFKNADSRLADAFTELRDTLSSISMPGWARYASADLAAAAGQTSYSLQQLQGATTMARYNEIWDVSSVLPNDVQVVHDYGYLQSVLETH